MLRLELVVDQMRPSGVFLLLAHGCPLERRERLWHEERAAGSHRYPAVSVLGIQFVIMHGHFLAEMGDALHVLLGLGRKAHHKVELYFVPTALECLLGAVENHFFRQSFVDHITHPLGSRLRRKGETALAHILHLAHHVQRKCVDTQGRQSDVDVLASEIINEIITQFRQMTIIAGA